MKERDEIFKELSNLVLDRTAVRMMKEDIAAIEKDEKQKELPAIQREALEKERLKLFSCMVATSNRISRIERLMAQLTLEERKVLETTLVDPRPGAVFDLAEEFSCETTRIYRIRSRALSKLVRLRYGAGSDV